jgi:3'-5' exoribonuclease
LAGKAFIVDIKDRDRVSGTFLVQQKQVPLNKNDKPYIAMVLMDRTGTIEARVWDNVERFAPLFDSGDFIEAGGLAVAYQGKVQLKVEKIKRLEPDSVDPEEFLPRSPRDRGEMLDRLRGLLSTIKGSGLRGLVLGCLDNDNFRESFAKAPAAKTIHHAYLGGLLEHTLAVCELADRVTQLYSHVDRDLLLAGAFFHDMGKIRELGSDRSFDYTDPGRLLGHIVMGAMMLNDLVEAHPGLPAETALKLTHMILSHHGSYEFGSPKRPKFTEALILNYLDELDSKIQTFKEIAEHDPGGKWSSYQRLFDRYIYLGRQDKPPEGTDLTHRPFKKIEAPPEPKPDAKPGEPLNLFRPDKKGGKS